MLVHLSEEWCSSGFVRCACCKLGCMCNPTGDDRAMIVCSGGRFEGVYLSIKSGTLLSRVVVCSGEV